MATNNPPKDADYYLDQLQSYKDAAAQWAQGEVTETNAGKLRDLIGEIQSIAKDADKDRKATKEPYLEQGRKIDAAFKPVASMADSFVRPLRKMLSEFLAEQERKQREAAEAARREAEEKARQAEAFKDDDFVGEHAAAQAKEAEAAAKRAAREAQHTNVAGSTGRAMGLRTYRKAKVTDAAQLVAYYAGHRDVIELCERLANAEIRSAKGAEIAIPGVEIVEEKVAA